MHVLWEDHRNDLFINGFGTIIFFITVAIILKTLSGILMSAGGSKLASWLDPTGAILVSFHES